MIDVLKIVLLNGLSWLYKLTIIVLEKAIDVLETILENGYNCCLFFPIDVVEIVLENGYNHCL